MSSTTNGAADTGGAAPTNTLTLGGHEVTIERPSSLKASRALAMLRGLSLVAPELQTQLAAFRVRYEAENFVELDRVQARVQYPERPVVADGEILLDEHGAPRMLPSPIDRISEEDWKAAGGKLRMPASPAQWEIALALLDSGVDAVENLLYRFLALFTIPNGELKQARKAGNLDELVQARADELLDDTFADELLELAVVVNETTDHHFRRKAKAIGGDRLGKLLALLPAGLRSSSATPTSSSTSTDSANATTPASPKPSSSTASRADTPDGPPTSSSTPPTTSSSTLEDSSRLTSSANAEPALEQTDRSSATTAA